MGRSGCCACGCITRALDTFAVWRKIVWHVLFKLRFPVGLFNESRARAHAWRLILLCGCAILPHGWVLQNALFKVLSLISEEAGYIERLRDGRCNKYKIRLKKSLRHPMEQHRTVKDLVGLIFEKSDEELLFDAQ